MKTFRICKSNTSTSHEILKLGGGSIVFQKQSKWRGCCSAQGQRRKGQAQMLLGCQWVLEEGKLRGVMGCVEELLESDWNYQVVTRVHC